MNEQFLLQMQQILKDEYPAYLESLSNPPTRGFRINPLKTNEKDFFEKVNVSHTKTSATMIIKNSDRVRLR